MFWELLYVTGNETTQLTEGYGIFAVEAKNQNPSYEPETVNTDGSLSTQAAWKAIFSNILVIRCFLPTFRTSTFKLNYL